MKIRGSVLINKLILFALLLMLTVGAMQRFRDWQESYQVLEQVEKRQFTEAYNHWREQMSDKSKSEADSSTSAGKESDTSAIRSAPPAIGETKEATKEQLEATRSGIHALE